MLYFVISSEWVARFNCGGIFEEMAFAKNTSSSSIVKAQNAYTRALADGSDKQKSAYSLACAGWEYFQKLIPNVADQKRFKDLMTSKDTQAITITGLGIKTPWDLLYFEEPSKAGIDPTAFLGWRCVSCTPRKGNINHGQLIGSNVTDIGLVETLMPHNCIMSKTATSDLLQNDQCTSCNNTCEAAAILGLSDLGFRRQAALDPNNNRENELKKIADWPFLKDSRVLHFSVRHEPGETEKFREDYRLKICNDFELTRDEVEQSYRSLKPRTTVFLNCCEGSFDLTGEAKTSLADEFGSASCVVAATAELDSGSAIAMSQRFYSAFKTETVTSAIIQARRSLWTDLSDLSGLFYRVHGEHEMRYNDPIRSAFPEQHRGR